LILLSVFSISGCSTLVGNVKPVDEKADHYRVLDLEAEKPNAWKKLPQEKNSVESSERSDLVFQSVDQTSIISLNSACRQNSSTSKLKLPAVAHELTLGFSDVEGIEESWLKVNGSDAYQKTLEGSLENQRTKLRVLIVSYEKCIYDFSLISSPKKFNAYEEDFALFVKSLNFR
jgi:hypothetical protein